MKIFKNVETSVEPYKIDQFERSHGKVEAKLVEQGENLYLRFHLVGHAFDYEVGFPCGFLHRAGELNARKCGLGIFRVHLAQFDGLIQIGADFSLGSAECVRQEIFENCAVATQCRHMSDATAHNTGANDGYSSGLRHYFPPRSKCSSIEPKLGSDLRIYSAKRLRSSSVMKGMAALMRRRVVAISST